MGKDLGLGDTAGLFVALADEELVVRIAAARALTRLPLDPEAAARFRRFRADFENRHLNWATFIPEPDLLERIHSLVGWSAEQEFNAATNVAAASSDRLAQRLAEAVLHEPLEDLDSESIAHAAEKLGPEYMPDFAAFFLLYEYFLRPAARFWFRWVDERRSEYDPATAAPSWFPLYEGALAASRHIEWIVSRRGMKPLLAALDSKLRNGSSRERFAAAQLIEWARRSESMPTYWRFGGGAAPGDVLAATPRDAIWKYHGPIPQASALAPPSPELPETPQHTPERAISFWIRERENNPSLPLIIGELYTAGCRVGSPIASSLITGASIPDSDVPASGLPTRWTILPQNVTLSRLDDRVSLTASGAVEFELLIPAAGDSETVFVGLVPNAPDARLTIIIQVGEKIYRECRLALDTGTEVIADIPAITLRHADLRTTHEWTTPPGVLNLFVLMPGKALISGSSNGTPFPPGEMVDLETAAPILTGPLDRLRAAAESFRAQWTSYLNDIDPNDLIQRLSRVQPQYDWAHLDDFADAAHAASWQSASASPELWSLAFYGKQLYDTMFRTGTRLRLWLDTLPPSQHIHVVWRPDSGAGFVPYIPWELLYTGEVKRGQAIEATKFWGLAYRLQYTAYRPPDYLSASLGAPLEACCTNVLFFGDSPKEPASAEARWQRQVWTTLSTSANACAVPGNGAGKPKPEIERALSAPESILPSGKGTVAVLYLYCHYDSSSGAPVLRFGLDSSNPDDILQETELSTDTLASYPLVFANACSTAGAGVLAANDLTRHFFSRGARAFIGSDCKVPPVLASRFAMVFFHFLLRLEDPQKQPMAAGEAMAQSRVFLWCHYKNIGGLLYSYLNQYDLYLASESELLTLVRGT